MASGDYLWQILARVKQKAKKKRLILPDAAKKNKKNPLLNRSLIFRPLIAPDQRRAPSQPALDRPLKNFPQKTFAPEHIFP
jgi:hypothetical protein